MESTTRVARSDGQRDPHEPKRERPVQGGGRPNHAAVLALQRAAGNAAVASLLGGERGQSARHLPPTPPVVQRNGKGKKRKEPERETFASAPEDFEHTTGAGSTQVRWTGSRPTDVRGPVVPTEVPSRGPTATPRAYAQQHQNGENHTRRLLGYDGGHVIGLHLGGPNMSENVVPMYPAFNRGVWKNMEDATKKDATERGCPYRIVITLNYTGVAPEVPTTLTVVREFFNSSTNAWVVALPSAPFSQPVDIIPTAPLSDADQRKVNPLAGDEFDPVPEQEWLDWFEISRTNMREYLNTNKHMPPSKKALYPDDPAKRPYGLLDILIFNRVVTLPVTFSSGRDFDEGQRTLILQTNMARNGGRIKSDDRADPHEYLEEQGAANFPEVDHIIPKSLGGSNFYSNARVVSWELNNKLARVKPLSGLVSLERLALPTLPRDNIDAAKTIVEQYLARHAHHTFTFNDVIGWASEKFSQPSNGLKGLIGTEITELRDKNQLVLNGINYRLP